MELKVLDHGYVKLIGSWGSDEEIIEAARMSTSKGFQGWDKPCPECQGSMTGAIDNGMIVACSTCEGRRVMVEKETSTELKVLDFGYVKLVESWGSDERIIESARMSTNKGFQGWDDRLAGNGSQIRGDARLLCYLWDHKHHTPFEMAGLTVEVQAPIFVFREWHRHRTQSYNEMSARYTELPDLFYVPSIERLMGGKQSKSNKQGSEEGFTETQALAIQGDISYTSHICRQQYNDMLRVGLSRELARLVIPVNQYSRMRASANLRNWLGFLDLRLAEGAQWEIRQFANAVGEIVGELFPRTYALFTEEHNAIKS